MGAGMCMTNSSDMWRQKLLKTRSLLAVNNYRLSFHIFVRTVGWTLRTSRNTGKKDNFLRTCWRCRREGQLHGKDCASI